MSRVDEAFRCHLGREPGLSPWATAYRLGERCRIGRFGYGHKSNEIYLDKNGISIAFVKSSNGGNAIDKQSGLRAVHPPTVDASRFVMGSVRNGNHLRFSNEVIE